MLAAPDARADDWLPHSAGATWQYEWTDSTYNPSGTIENVLVQQQGTNFTLDWADPQDQSPAAGATSISCPPDADIGTMSFEDSSTGLVNTDWNSCPPPSSYPSGLLCPGGTTRCPNSLAGVFYNVIWGSRNPVLSEPLLQGATWNASGGASGEVASTSHYLGLQLVKVPAFPAGVVAAVVQSNIADPPGNGYGSGIRTTWWVYGVGPVRVVFDHVGGSITNVNLTSTNLKPIADRPDQDYFPLRAGAMGTYKWTNTKHLIQPEVETVSVRTVVNRWARITVRSVSGPMRAAGTYDFTDSLDGLRNVWGTSSAASLARLPALGHGRHFFTPIDLMTFGFGPVLPAYPVVGAGWRSGNAHDLSVYGVTGSTKVIGIASVHVPAGTFRALEVRSVLSQRRSRFGSGVRTVWFAAGRGLVKLVFQHRDGSVSVVQLLR
jgi:hypothetical protein